MMIKIAPAEQLICPEGSYNIGEEKNGQVICKIEPTGCVNGDSIPLDSPKCENNEPPKEVVAPEPLEPYKEEDIYVGSGK